MGISINEMRLVQRVKEITNMKRQALVALLKKAIPRKLYYIQNYMKE